MLAECFNCGFYVNENEKFCPDCGVSDPNLPLTLSSDNSDQPLTLKSTVIIVIAIIIGIALLRLVVGSGNFSSELFGLTALILLIIVVLLIFVVPFITRRAAKREKQQRFDSAETATNFRFIQDTILLRNHELKEKLREFRSLAKRGKRLSGNVKKSKALLKTVEIQSLIARYDLLNNKIDFARLQNNLLPIIEQQNDLKSKADYSENLAEILSEIELIILSLTDEYAAKIPEQFENERRDFLAQVTETQKLCETLSESKNEVQTFHNNFEIPSSNDLTYQTENLDAQLTLRNFTASFNELEQAYERLKIDQQ